MSDEQPEPVAKVSLSAIYGVVLDTQQRVVRIEERVNDLAEDSQDHEKRIRALEKRVWIAAGAALIGGAGLSEVVGKILGS